MKGFLEKLREDMPETNSSSSHAVVIGKGNRSGKDLFVDKDGVVRIPGNVDFGWEVDTITDPLTKIQYAIGLLGGKNKLKKLKLLTDVIKEYTGAKEIIFDWSSASEYPSVDHQSTDLELEIWESASTLKDFIFSEDSVLYTGNDNSGENEDYEKVYYDISNNATITLDFTSFNLGVIDFRVNLEDLDDSLLSNDDLTEISQSLGVNDLSPITINNDREICISFINYGKGNNLYDYLDSPPTVSIKIVKLVSDTFGEISLDFFKNYEQNK